MAGVALHVSTVFLAEAIEIFFHERYVLFSVRFKDRRAGDVMRDKVGHIRAYLPRREVFVFPVIFVCFMSQKRD